MKTTEQCCQDVHEQECELWRRLLSKRWNSSTRAALPPDLVYAGLPTCDAWRALLRTAVTAVQAVAAKSTTKVKHKEAHEISRALRTAQSVRNEIVRRNMGLVYTAARRTKLPGDTIIDFADLTQQGALGLIRASELFNIKLGYKFSTYATWWIKHVIIRYIKDMGHQVRLPIHIQDRLDGLHAIAAELKQRLGRPPTDNEIAIVAMKRGVIETDDEDTEKGIDRQMRRTRQADQVNRNRLHLDAPVGEAYEPFYNAIPDEHGLDEIRGWEIDYDLTRALECSDRAKRPNTRLSLSPSELLIARSEGATLQQIGNDSNLSRERIRQIETHFRNEARKHLRVRNVAPV